ncbi:hypothetical protein R6V09_18385 [Streptomyces sp. W16]|uniref:hypothetical protein n=1 Tax=Streptomyces sp. W16 TaxID=3076631 RepID=UPI00295B0725|nr:hypothetical protein [Streptomyces sp. W16]MDV9172072.1 hypothetical protein [Streptomyces sp. W16]
MTVPGFTAIRSVRRTSSFCPDTATARRTHEATGPQGLLARARKACALEPLRDTGVRAVSNWDFAEQDLPDGIGRVVWTCVPERPPLRIGRLRPRRHKPLGERRRHGHEAVPHPRRTRCPQPAHHRPGQPCHR